MKKIWLMGGFGNVLFQILAYNVISKTNVNVFYVTKLTEKNSITKYLKWTIHKPIYENLIDTNQIINVKSIPALFTILIAILSNKFKIESKISTVYNKNFQLKNPVSENIFGYFQEKEFLSENKKELLSLGEKLRTLYSSSTKTPIVVHYRKGDSDWVDKYPNYYNQIKKMLKKESLPIMIVSDSIEDANYFFKDVKNIKILSSNNAIDDFKYLVSADKLYCAPSTFSWWALHSLKKESEIVVPKFFDDYLGVYVNRKGLTVI
jgi:hypothetical protein